jgi:uncharacterized membrane protein YqgA involved in biofilm formation
MKNKHGARMDVFKLYMQGLMVVFFGLVLANFQNKLPEDMSFGVFMFIGLCILAIFVWMGRAYVKEAIEIDKWEAKEKERT